MILPRTLPRVAVGMALSIRTTAMAAAAGKVSVLRTQAALQLGLVDFVLPGNGFLDAVLD